MSGEPTRPTPSPEDVDGVMKAALDYIDGYTDGDRERHLASYHPECVKRRLEHDDETGVARLVVLSPTTMADHAALESPSPSGAEVFIDDISDDIASVRIYSNRWVDFLHIAKARGEWRLFHVTWHRRR